MSRNTEGELRLLECAATGDTDTVIRLIHAHINVNCKHHINQWYGGWLQWCLCCNSPQLYALQDAASLGVQAQQPRRGEAADTARRGCHCSHVKRPDMPGVRGQGTARADCWYEATRLFFDFLFLLVQTAHLLI